MKQSVDVAFYQTTVSGNSAITDVRCLDCCTFCADHVQICHEC